MIPGWAQAPIITGMDVTAIVQGIDAEISRMEKARALLTGHTAPLKDGVPPSEPNLRGTMLR